MREHPCKKDCPDRAAGCGATCPDWQKYVKERDAEYEQRKKQHELNQMFFDAKIKVIRKSFNRRKK